MQSTIKKIYGEISQLRNLAQVLCELRFDSQKKKDWAPNSSFCASLEKTIDTLIADTADYLPTVKNTAIENEIQTILDDIEDATFHAIPIIRSRTSILSFYSF